MAAVDTKGLTSDIRQKALHGIKDKLSDHLKQENKICNDHDLECLAAKFEQKIVEKAVDKDDYGRIIINKLNRLKADNQKVSAESTAGDGLRNGMTAKPVVHFDSVQQNDGNCLLKQKPNMITAQHQSSHQPMLLPSTVMQPRNAAVQTISNLLGQQLGQQFVQRDQGYLHLLSAQPVHGPLTVRHQRKIVPQTTTNRLDQQFVQQNSIQTGVQYPLVQQSRMPKGEFRTTNSMLSVDRFQQPVKSANHVTNGNAQQMPSRDSSPYLQVVSQGQRNRPQDCRLQRAGMPCTNFSCQNFGCKNNQVVQSHVPSTAASSAFSSFPDTETTNADWKLFKDEYHRTRLLYVPALQNLGKKIQDQLLKAQSMESCQRLKQSIYWIRQYLFFLNAPETELIRRSIDELRKILDTIRRYHANAMSQLTISGMSQTQFAASHEQTCANGVQNTLPVNTKPVSSSTRFPSVMEQAGSLSSQSSAENSPFHVPVHAKEQIDRKPLLQSVSQGISDHNTHFSTGPDPKVLPSSSSNQTPGTSQSVKLPGKEKDNVDSTTRPITNPAARISEKSRPKRQPSATSHESWLSLAGPRKKSRSTSGRLPQRSSVLNEKKRDASPLSNAGAVSETKASVSSVSLPSTPITPSSLPNEIGNSVKSSVPELPAGKNGNSLTSGEVNECRDEHEIQGKFVDLGTPAVLASPVVLDCVDHENSQHSRSSMQPIDRLLEAVQSVHRESLVSAVDDMRSAIAEMDELPAYAFLDGSSVTLDDDDLDIFLEEVHFSIDDVDEDKRIKRDFESVSRDISTLSNPMWRSRPEPKRELLDEISQINEIFFETVTEVVFDSDNKCNGITVRCTYKPMAVHEDIERAFVYNGKPSLNLSIEFLVPLNYPDVPPKILDKLPHGCVGYSSDMTERAKSLFDNEVRSIEPLRVGEMAKLWNDCSELVFWDHAKSLEAETFTSKFGSWERVLPTP